MTVQETAAATGCLPPQNYNLADYWLWCAKPNTCKEVASRWIV